MKRIILFIWILVFLVISSFGYAVGSYNTNLLAVYNLSDNCDDTLGNWSMTLSGTLVNVTGFRGDAGGAMDNTGTGFCSVASNKLDGAGNGTIMFRLKMSSLVASARLLGLSDGGGADFFFSEDGVSTNGRIYVTETGVDSSVAHEMIANNWYTITVFWNNTGMGYYVNDSLKTFQAVANPMLISATTMALFRTTDAAANDFEDTLDEVYVWKDRQLNADEVADIWSNDLYYPFAPVPEFINPTPTDAAVNSSQVTINVSCETGTITLWFDNQATPDTKVIDGLPSPSQYTTSVASDGTYYYIASCDSGVTNSSTRSWIYDNTNPTITLNSNNHFNISNQSNVSATTMILNITASDNINLVSFRINITKDGTVYYNYTNSSFAGNTETIYSTKDITSFPNGKYDVDIYATDDVNERHSAYTFELYTFLIGNCTTYNNTLFNWTFYRRPDSTTTGDDKVNITCIFDGSNSTSFLEYHYGIGGSGVCSQKEGQTPICTGYIKYTGDWTQGYIYSYNINGILYNTSSITSYNLTIPKLFLNFTSITDVIVIDNNGVYYFNDTKILIAMTNLSLGKVSVIFNNGTQYFEYENDRTTYVHEDMKILTQQDDWVKIRAQDQVFSILPDAIIEIYELDWETNTTNFVSQIYSNNEKSVKLKSNSNYLIKSYLSGYTQDNYFYPFKPSELEGDDVVITMKESNVEPSIKIYSNYGNSLPTGVDHTIIIYIDGANYGTIDTMSMSFVLNG